MNRCQKTPKHRDRYYQFRICWLEWGFRGRDRRRVCMEWRVCWGLRQGRPRWNCRVLLKRRRHPRGTLRHPAKRRPHLHREPPPPDTTACSDDKTRPHKQSSRSRKPARIHHPKYQFRSKKALHRPYHQHRAQGCQDAEECPSRRNWKGKSSLQPPPRAPQKVTLPPFP